MLGDDGLQLGLSLCQLCLSCRNNLCSRFLSLRCLLLGVRPDPTFCSQSLCYHCFLGLFRLLQAQLFSLYLLPLEFCFLFFKELLLFLNFLLARFFRFSSRRQAAFFAALVIRAFTAPAL